MAVIDTVLAIGFAILQLNPDGSVVYGGPVGTAGPMSANECIEMAHINNSQTGWKVGNVTIFCAPMVEQTEAPPTTDDKLPEADAI